MQSGKSIEELLDKENITLENVLDEEDVIQEVRNGNNKLMEFFTYERLATLIDFVTVLPVDDGNTKRCYKFPFVTTELFSCENERFLEKFLLPDQQTPILITRLFSFLRNQDVQNPILAGYFSKVMISFISKVPKLLFTFLFENQNYVEDMLLQIQSKSIQEVVSRIVTLEDNFLLEKVDRDHFCQIRQTILYKIVDILTQGNEQESSNSCQILLDLLFKINEVIDGVDVIRFLQDGEKLQSVMETIFKCEGQNLQYGLVFLQSLLNQSLNKSKSFERDELFFDLPQQEEQVNPKVILPNQQILNLIGDFIYTISQKLNNQLQNEITFQLAQNIRLLGIQNLRLVEFLYSSLKMNNQTINQAFINSDVFQKCLDLFSEYCWNNFLHNLIEMIVKHILQDSNDEQLIQYLLDKVDIVSFILQIISNPFFIHPVTQKKYRKGNLGHVTKMSNLLLREAGKQKYICDFLNQRQDWGLYASNQLKSQNEMESRNLGGNRYTSSPSIRNHEIEEEMKEKYYEDYKNNGEIEEEIEGDNSNEVQEEENVFKFKELKTENQNEVVSLYLGYIPLVQHGLQQG